MIKDFIRSPYTFIFTGYAILIALAISGCGSPFKGSPGDPGASGKDSEPCTVTRITGGTQIDCDDGTSAEIPDPVDGKNGQTGAQGVPGPVGPSGTPGVDPTPITVVQLCSSVGPPVYPTTFPEVAWCISGALYGVYDQDGNHVFLSVLPPGAYSSTSPAGCNFTVGLNCAVSE